MFSTTDHGLPALPATITYILDGDDGWVKELQEVLAIANLPSQRLDRAERLLSFVAPGTPACLVTDLHPPGATADALLEEMSRRHIILPTVVVSGMADVSSTVRLMQHGAVNVIRKPAVLAEVLASVREAHEIARRRAHQHQQRALSRAMLNSLSAREKQVLEMILEGRVSKQIAADLGLSIKTVEYHRARLMQKLSARNLADLVRRAVSMTAA